MAHNTVTHEQTLFGFDGVISADTHAARASARLRAPRRETKKDRIVALFRGGEHDVERIASEVGTKPSYVASVLQSAGLLRGYFDLYTTTNNDQNAYSRFFRGVLGFKTIEDARQSVERIDSLYRYFERIGDRAGQHHAEVLALTGRNRARWSNKKEEAEIFMRWLTSH